MYDFGFDFECEIEAVERAINYAFENKDLLRQAFIRKSFSEENGGQNNEVLEFIGDKAHDLAVIRVMMERFGSLADGSRKYFRTAYGEGRFSDIKQGLVKKTALSEAMDKLGFHRYLVMGRGDVLQNVQDEKSVKEDLFEAIVGAVALDCNWNIDVITAVVKRMIDFDSYFASGIGASKNYVGLVQEWFQVNVGELPQYRYLSAEENTTDEPKNAPRSGIGTQKCQLWFGGECYNGYGNSNAEARAKCAELFYRGLESSGMIADPALAVVGVPTEETAVSKLNELHQKGYISQPRYAFRQERATDGGIEWRCECYVEENGRTFVNFASNKPTAKKMSAFDALLDLMGLYDD